MLCYEKVHEACFMLAMELVRCAIYIRNVIHSVLDMASLEVRMMLIMERVETDMLLGTIVVTRLDMASTISSW